MRKLLAGTMMATLFFMDASAKSKKVTSKDNISAEADTYSELKKSKVLTKAEIKTLNAAVSNLSKEADYVFQSLKTKAIKKSLKVMKICVDTIANFAKSAEKKTTVDEDTDRKMRYAVGGIKANIKYLAGKYHELFRSFSEHVITAGDVLNQLSRRNPNNEVLKKSVDILVEIEQFLNEKLKNSLKKQKSEPNIWKKASIPQSEKATADDEFFDAKETEEPLSQQSSISAENISEQQSVLQSEEASDDDEFFDAKETEEPLSQQSSISAENISKQQSVPQSEEATDDDEFFDAKDQEWPSKENNEKLSHRTAEKNEKLPNRTAPKSEPTVNKRKNRSLRRSGAHIFGLTGITYNPANSSNR